MPLAKDVNLKAIAKETEGFTGADIENMCREAGMEAIRKNIKAKEVTAKDFKFAKAKIKPSATKKYKEHLESFKKNITMFG